MDRPQTEAERQFLKDKLTQLSSKKDRGIAKALLLSVFVGGLLSATAAAAVALVLGLVENLVTVPDRAFLYAFTPFALLIAGFAVWLGTISVSLSIQKRRERNELIAYLQADLETGRVEANKFQIIEYLILFDERWDGLAYLLRTRGEQVLFCWDANTYWIPSDKAESGPYKNWDPRDEASLPHEGLETVRAPVSGQLFSAIWTGNLLKQPEDMIRRPTSEWPVTDIDKNIVMSSRTLDVRELPNDWTETVRNYGG